MRTSSRPTRLCLPAILAIVAVCLAAAQQRPPAVPLVAHNPYFSIWSMADQFTDQGTKRWTGTRQPIAGLAHIDGKTYRFIGERPRDVPAMKQTSLVITPTQSIYTFQAGQVTLAVAFSTPAFPKDLDVLSRPVTCLTFSTAAQGDHDLSVLIDVDPVIAVNTPDEAVTWGRSHAQGLTVLNADSRDQRVLNRAGDDLRIDWGYFHLAVSDAAGTEFVESRDAMQSFASTGVLSPVDDMDTPRTPREQASHPAVVLPMGKLSKWRNRIELSRYDVYVWKHVG